MYKQAKAIQKPVASAKENLQKLFKILDTNSEGKIRIKVPKLI